MSHPTCCCASLDRCNRCDLLVDLEGFHLMSVTRTPDALLVLDVESRNQLAGCPGCGLNRTRPRAYGGGSNLRALGRGPGADLVAQTPMDMPRTHLPDRDLHRAEQLGVRTQGASGRPSDPLGDPTTALRGSHYLGAGPPVRNQWNTVRPHIKPRLQAASDDFAVSQGCGYLGPLRWVQHRKTQRYARLTCMFVT